MISCKDFYSIINYSASICENGDEYSIYNKWLLDMFLESEKDGYIVVTTLEKHRTHTFIKFDITEKGQNVLDMERL